MLRPIDDSPSKVVRYEHCITRADGIHSRGIYLMNRSAVFSCLFFVLLLSLVSQIGCGPPKVPVAAGSGAQFADINYLTTQLSDKIPANQTRAMFWIRQLKPSEGQPAVSKLQELVAKSKDPKVKKAAEETLKHIQGG